MALAKEVRLLKSKWDSSQGWPKKLEWLEIDGLRGWSGQRIDFRFPIVAIVGENGVGKSTVIQAIAASYRGESDDTTTNAARFFPGTTWDEVIGVSIRVSVREGLETPSVITSVRKPTNRWRGNPERRKRPTVYIDLRRIQPIAARVGYARLAKPNLTESSIAEFDALSLQRLSGVMGRKYQTAKFSTTNLDDTRDIPVLQRSGVNFSGFHQGAGETTIAELLKYPLPKYSIVLIDEIETSLHPRVQRRLMRDLAARCRERELQIVLTTHSPYVLEELPPEARVYLMDSASGKQVISGVSPDFAMTQMDEDHHPEADVYVEDHSSAAMLREILVVMQSDLVSRIQVIPFGTASVGKALGQMVESDRFPRPSHVFLDGDQDASPGCHLLPGGDAPERVVFESLATSAWDGIAGRLGRGSAEVIDACNAAMALPNHHDWVIQAANRLVIGGEILWQALCAQWASTHLNRDTDGRAVADLILDSISGI